MVSFEAELEALREEDLEATARTLQARYLEKPHSLAVENDRYSREILSQRYDFAVRERCAAAVVDVSKVRTSLA